MNSTPAISCQFWTHPNRCAVAGKTVSFGVCRHCLANDLRGEHLTPKLRGLGDLVAKIIRWFLLLLRIHKRTPCRGCQERQNKLNAIVPFNEKNYPKPI